MAACAVDAAASASFEQPRISDDFDGGTVNTTDGMAAGDGVYEPVAYVNLNCDDRDDRLEIDGPCNGEDTRESAVRLMQTVDASAQHGVQPVHHDDLASGQGFAFGGAVRGAAIFGGRYGRARRSPQARSGLHEPKNTRNNSVGRSLECRTRDARGALRW
jgi:hypothetical protein